MSKVKLLDGVQMAQAQNQSKGECYKNNISIFFFFKGVIAQLHINCNLQSASTTAVGRYPLKGRNYFYSLSLVTRQSAVLDFSSQHAIS